MRFMMMTTNDGTIEPTPPNETMMAEMGAFIDELTKSGALLATGGLEPGGTRLSVSGGKVTVTDGPFTEAKEAVVGFALIEVRTKEEAIELAKRFWGIAGDGQGVIQQVFGPEDVPS